MIASQTTIRIGYSETDRMGYAYHGHYAKYFEIARTDWCRGIGLTYKEIEEQGILMPVMELNIKYRLPIFYDDLITFHVYLKELPGWRMKMEGESVNEAGKVTSRFWAELGFMDKASMRPVRVPEFITNTIAKHWEAES